MTRGRARESGARGVRVTETSLRAYPDSSDQAARVGVVHEEKASHEEQASMRHPNSSRTGSFFNPPTKLVCMTFMAPTTSIDLIWGSSTSYITFNSSFARYCPMHMWGPYPNAMCLLGLRSMSNVSGWSKTAASRLPDW